MQKILVLALVATCSAASAQTPATNPMPDGSRDMYAGLGAVSAPRYEGAASTRVSALPVLQIQWSTGIFVSGMSAGMHLSSSPSVEFGPLLALQTRRSESGSSTAVGGVEGSGLPSVGPQPQPGPALAPWSGNRLAGMDDIGARLQLGGFLNHYLARQVRLTSSVLYGAGNARNGGYLKLGVQRIAGELVPHHSVSVEAGLTVANRNYNQAFFGVSRSEAERSGNRKYALAGGLKDAHVGARWNWALSPAWLLTSGVQATRLLGNPTDSPLVERSANLTVSSAIARRF
jgi:outer membrane protein